MLQENSSTSRPFTGFTAKAHGFIWRNPPPWESSQMYTYKKSQIELYTASIGCETLAIEVQEVLQSALFRHLLSEVIGRLHN